jgi:hypothetical protein
MANEQSVWNLLEITLAIFPAHVDAGIAMLFPSLSGIVALASFMQRISKERSEISQLGATETDDIGCQQRLMQSPRN